MTRHGAGALAAGLVLAGGLAAAGEPPRAQADHIMLGIRDLDEGIRLFEARTGVKAVVGGEHPGRGTRNALAALGPALYVEIIAPQAGAKPDSSAQVSGLQALAELTPLGWAVAVPDVEAARQALLKAGFEVSPGQPGSRRKPDGSTLSWTTFGVTKPQIPGLPFFIRWGDGTAHPASTSPGGCRLDALTIASPGAPDVLRVLEAVGVSDVPVKAGEKAGLALSAACPKGTVRFATP